MTSGTGGLVGRAAELRATSAAIDAVVGGTGGLLLIDGEAGIGKTSLLEVLGAEGEARGLTVLRASATALDRIRSDRPTHGWDALTRSEWGIARLVGEGRSNPEIATELVVSRRTVESHLSRIYTKLEVANRTELALSLRDRELA